MTTQQPLEKKFGKWQCNFPCSYLGGHGKNYEC